MAFLWEALLHLSFSALLRKLFTVLVSIGILALLHNIFSSSLSIASALSQLYPVFAMPLILLTIFVALQRKIATAGYFFVAEFFMLVGSIAFILVIQGKIIAEAKNEAKSQFFASMSHEFRTPLTAILGYSEAARGNALTKEEILKHVETIERGGKHLLQLVNDILDMSKIDAQKLEVEKLDVSIAELLRDMHDYFSILAAKKGIHFIINCHFPLPCTITSDPTRLRQTLINICGNAVKFTEQGSVTLNVTCDKRAQKISFAVKDTGIGIKPEQVNRLFGAYTQVDMSAARNFGGTGLGLHLAKKIAEKLGGDITIDTYYGKGSVFTVTVSTGDLSKVSWLEKLPEEHSATGIVSLSDDSLNDQKELRVLLAEDNLDNQVLITLHLNKAGCETVIANDGLDALGEVHKQGEFDLVLMDMQMPNMNGVTAVRHLRDKGYAGPIYSLTADESPVTIEESIAAGCNGHLSKPLDIDKLKSVIQLLRN
jgi:signal transduction histidine kinase/CheY-like chemotaxis protein